jgi:hypothetical protein
MDTAVEEMTEKQAYENDLWAIIGRNNDRETAARAASLLEQIGKPRWAQAVRRGHESGRA